MRIQFIRIIRLLIAEIEENFEKNARIELHQDLGTFLYLSYITAC